MLNLEIKQPNLIQWQTTNKVFHNLLYPAYISWYPDTSGVKKQKSYEQYLVNGKQHRDPTEGPASTCWYPNGQKNIESYRVNGKRHRNPNEGPAHTTWHFTGQKFYEAYWVLPNM